MFTLNVSNHASVLKGASINLIAILGLSFFITPYMTVATIAYCALVWGLLLRKTRKAHTFCMNTGILLDLILVFILEFQRDAIGTAVSFELSFFEQLHIITSSISVLFYIPTLVLGWARFSKKSLRKGLCKWHERLGLIAFFFRTLGFLLMFSLLDKVAS